MFVCVCNALRLETVKSLAQEGLGFGEIQAVTNLAGNCGSCREFAEQVIDQVHQQLPQRPTLPLTLRHR